MMQSDDDEVDSGPSAEDAEFRGRCSDPSELLKYIAGRTISPSEGETIPIDGSNKRKHSDGSDEEPATRRRNEEEKHPEDGDDELLDGEDILSALDGKPQATDGSNKTLEKEELVPIMHPQDAQINRLLGEKSPADSVCYMCHKVDWTDAAKISEKILELKKMISDGRKDNSDRISLAKKVQKKFETDIRGPVNSRIELKIRQARVDDDDEDEEEEEEEEKIEEWTLRSIYDHICSHDVSTAAILDRGIESLNQMADTIRTSALYMVTESEINPDGTIAPKTNVHVSKNGCQQMLATYRTLLMMVKERGQIGDPPSSSSSSTTALTKQSKTHGTKSGKPVDCSISAVAASASGNKKSNRRIPLFQ